ncbi:hypothetical protein J3R30DRAFT_3695731 [Lentinula aciculospora]|uniref:Zn(2)-C6 fungal-type domain-containing protein n=1 Tax=Lentinula aciculospora TaxID=153920 RepID=A0A9W9AQ58_9AGAR|nr:hypothetical protein J3R30DRAFT_3695731 [Lentinula aciculospora]
MAAIEKRGAFTDPWGREFLSDGTLVKGKEGDQDQAEEDSSDDQLSEHNDVPAVKTVPTPKTLPKIKLKVTPNFDGPESEEETGGSGGNRRPPLPTTTTTATMSTVSSANTLGGKTVPATKSKAKEVLSIRVNAIFSHSYDIILILFIDQDPPCWRCKTLNKPCESSSLRFSCTTCYKRHWACSMNPPPPRQKKASSHHSAPPKTRSLPVIAAGTNIVDAGESISVGPITRGRSPLRSGSKGVKRPRSITPPPAVEIVDNATENLGDSGPSGTSLLYGVSEPQNKKTRTSLRTSTKPQSQPQRPQIKLNSAGVSAVIPALNQGTVRPISTYTPPATQAGGQNQAQSHTRPQNQAQSQTSALTLSEIKYQVDTLIQRDEKSHAVLEQHSVILDAVLINMKVLLGDKFIEVGKTGNESAHMRSQEGSAKEGEAVKRDGKVAVPTLSITAVQDPELEELDELDELTPIEKLTPTPIPSNGLGVPPAPAPSSASLSTSVNGNPLTVTARKSKSPLSAPTPIPPSGLIGPATAGTFESSQPQAQRVERPPRIISVPSIRAPVAVPSPIQAPPQAPVPFQASGRDSAPVVVRAPVLTVRDPAPPSTSSAHVHNGVSADKPKPKLKATNPYPNIPSAPPVLPRTISGSARLANVATATNPPNIPAISTLPTISALPATPLSPASTTSAVDDDQGVEGGYVADASHAATPVLILPSTKDRYHSRSRSRSPLPGRSIHLPHSSHAPQVSQVSRPSNPSRSSYTSLTARTTYPSQRLTHTPPPLLPHIRRQSSLSPSPPPSHTRFGYTEPYRTQHTQQRSRRSPYSSLSPSRSQSPYSRSPPPYGRAPPPHIRDNSDMQIDSLVEPYPSHLDRDSRDLPDLEDSSDLGGMGGYERDLDDLHDLHDLDRDRREAGVEFSTEGNSGDIEPSYPGELDISDTRGDPADVGNVEDAGNTVDGDAGHAEGGDDIYYPDEVRYSASR